VHAAVVDEGGVDAAVRGEGRSASRGVEATRDAGNGAKRGGWATRGASRGASGGV
jgi:hypothetical protein